MKHAPPALLAVAGCTGVAYANLAVALPLYVLAIGRPPSYAGDLLAGSTLAFALGAIAASPLIGRLGGRNILALGLLGTGTGLVVLVGAGTAGLIEGPLVCGAGMGLFWVGSQATLAGRAGADGSERGFVAHYVFYISGTALGSVATGAAITALRAAGAGHVTSIRLAFALGAVVVLAALVPCRPTRHHEPQEADAEPLNATLPLRGLAVQLPDFFLVSALALLVTMAPVVLRKSFDFSPVSVGAVMGAVAGARIAGNLTAATIASRIGSRGAILVLLLAGTALSLGLVVAHAASLYVAVLLPTALVATGAWPIIVDAAHARIEPAQRGGLAVAWNAREFVVIAAATAAGGWLFTAFDGPDVMFLVAALLLAGAATAAATVLRRPVHEPRTS